MKLDSETRQALEQLMSEFAWRVDHGQADRVHELFTEDGRIEGPGWTLGSRDDIQKEFARKAEDRNRVSRHLWSNPRFEVLGPKRIQVSTVVQTFVCSLGEDDRPPAPNQQFVVGDSIDVMRHDNNAGWLFESRALQVVFAPRD